MMTSWDDDDWKILLEKVRKQQVIPIIGKDLITVSHQGKQIPLYHLICTNLISEYNLPVDCENMFELETISHKAIKYRNIRPEDLKLDIIHMVKKLEAENLINTNGLAQIARITDFKLLINTTFTPYIYKELELVYEQNERNRSLFPYCINYSPKSHQLIEDLENIPLHATPLQAAIGSSARDLKHRCLFNLFGNFEDKDEQMEYLLTDCDTIDLMVWLLKHEKWQNSKLYDLILSSNSHFLFLGCSFPNWLQQLFVRVFSRNWNEFDRGKDKYLADNLAFNQFGKNKEQLPDEELLSSDYARTMFLSNHSVRIFGEESVSTFVDKLYQKWKAMDGITHVSSDEIEEQVVFVSFASENRTMVMNFCEKLKAFADIWFDEKDLKTGHIIREELKSGIDKACVFVPVITAEAMKRDKGHFRQEWEYAIRRMAGGHLRIFPVFVGTEQDTPNDSFQIPEEFGDIKYLRIENPKVVAQGNIRNFPDIVDFMKEIQRIQREKRKYSQLMVS
jgi:hypothetical protein